MPEPLHSIDLTARQLDTPTHAVLPRLLKQIERLPAALNARRAENQR